MTLEGVVEGGQIRLQSGVRLPEKTKVYVLVPDLEIERIASVHSPRLAHPEQLADFVLEILEEPADAGI